MWSDRAAQGPRVVGGALCGLSWLLLTACGAALDSDHDGVKDALDQCPDDRGSAEGAGCPVRAIADRDHDGVNDYVDACPNLPAPGKADGCPALPAAGAAGTPSQREAP